MGKYFKTPRVNICSVNFKILDAQQKIVLSESASCYSTVTYGKVSTNYKQLLTLIREETCPYDEQTVKRWLNDLNEFGFPCEYLGIDHDTYQVMINFDDFKNVRVHMTSTLMLIRALLESKINRVPDVYFTLLDESKDLDLNGKFRLLQKAHVMVYTEDNYANCNHMVKYDGDICDHIKIMDNIFSSKETLTNHYSTCTSFVWNNKKYVSENLVSANMRNGKI